MAQLNGTAVPVGIAPGYRLMAPGLVGSATAREPRPIGSADRGPEQVTTAFDQALTAAGLHEILNVDLDVREVAVALDGPDVRTASGEEGLVLEVPDLGPEVGQVVLTVDEAGVVTWSLPETPSHTIEPPTVRGARGTKRFVVRRSTPPTPPTDEVAERGLFGAVGRKLLKVLVYPVTDAVLGPVSERFAHAWETRRRPYGLRSFRPGQFRVPSAGMLTGDELRFLAEGPALLFVHGTFSTSHGAFAALPDATFAELHRRYEGRVFAFDHFTLSHTPEQNVAELAGRLPDNVRLEVDIVSHSRGGLVARSLAGELEGVTCPGLDVRRAVFVATPNHGTALADADHMVDFIDRYTSVLNLVPPGPAEVVSEILEAVVTVVKVLGHAMLRGLPGLLAMDPRGDFIARLNSGGPPSADYYALAADYRPSGPLKTLVVATIADAVVDRVFGRAANDLVVPTLGVTEGSADPAFPLASHRAFAFPDTGGVLHTNFFGDPETSTRLLRWLGR